MTARPFFRSPTPLLAMLACVPLVRLLWDVSRGFDHLMYQFLADDAFYYFEISRHLPEFNRGIPTSGFHPLYALLIAPLHRALDYELAIPASLLLLVSAHGLGAVALHRVLSAYWPGPIPLLCAAAWALSGKLYSLAMTGVETLLATLCVLLFLVQFSRIDGEGAERASPARFAALGALAGLAFLARMDAPLLLAPFGLLLLAGELRRRRAAPLALLAASALALVLPWMAFMWIETGSFFPTSGAALRVLRGIDAGVFATPELIARSARKFVEHLTDFLVTSPDALRTPLLAGAALAALAGAVWGRPTEGRERALRRFEFAALAGLALWASYYVFFQGGFRRWYFAYLGIGVFGVLLPRALSLLFRSGRPGGVRLAVGCALVLASLLLVRPGPTGPQEYDKFRSALAADPRLEAEGSTTGSPPSTRASTTTS